MFNKCSPVNTSAANPNQPSVPSTAPDSLKKARQVVSTLNSVSDTPLSLEALEQAIRDHAYRVEMAEAVILNPRAGRNKGNAIRRQLQRMAGHLDTTQLTKFLLETKRLGENAITALPLLAGRLDVTMARLDYSMRIKGLRDEYFRIARSSGIKDRKVLKELWVGAVEVGSFNRFNSDSMGANAQRWLATQQRNYVSRVRSLGIDGNTYQQLNKLVEQAMTVDAELLRIAKGLGVDIDELKGIGYFNRNFSPDFQRRMRRQRIEELEKLGLDGVVRESKSSAMKSRSTYDYIVEDEARMAQALGLTKDRLSRPVGTYRNMLENLAEKVTATRKALDEFGVKYREEVSQLNQGVDKIRQATKEANAKFRDRIVKEFATRRAEAQQGLQVQLDTLTKQRDNVLRSLDKKLSDFDTKKAAKQRELEQKLAKYEYGVENGMPGYSSTTLTKMRENLTKSLNDLAERARTLADEVEVRRQKVDEDFTQRVDTVTNKLNESFKKLDAEFNTARAKGEADIQTRLDESVKNYEVRRAQLDKERDKLIDANKAAVEAHDTLQDQFLTELEAPLNELAAKLNDEKVILNDLLEMDLDTLTRLVDEGVLSKVPMTSARMFEVLKKRYKLPYEGLDELMETDPVRAHEFYKGQLQRSMGQSNMARGLVQAAMEQGWGVSRTVAEAFPQKYGEYVPITDVLKANGFDLKQLGFEAAKDLMVPQELAQDFAAMVDTSISPQNLGTFARIFEALGKVTKRSMLSSVGFIMRNVYGSLMQGMAAGQNLLHLPATILEYSNFLKNGVEALDNTRKVYANGTLTLRELVLEAKARGRLAQHNFIGEEAAFNADSMRRRLTYMAQSLREGDGLGTLQNLGAAIDVGTSKILSAFMAPTIWFEDIVQLNVLKTIMGNGVTDRFAQTLTYGLPKVYTNIDEAIGHLDRYFINYDDVSKFDRQMSRYVAPFWTFVSRNLPMQVRNAMRHPGRMVAYLRLHELMNAEAESRGEDLPEGGVNQFILDGMPILIKSPDGNPNQWFSIQTETFDGIAEMWSLLNYEFRNDTSQEKVEAVLPEGRGEVPRQPAWLTFAINQTFPLIKTLYATATGVDPFTEAPLREEEAFLGFEVPSILGLRPGVVRYLVENNVPFVRGVNKMNPAQLFGVSEVRNAYGDVIRQGRRSIFGAQRTDRDYQIMGDDREATLLLSTARLLGFTATENRVDENMQRTYTFYDTSARAFKEEANNLLNQWERTTDEQRREELMHQHVIAMARWAEVEKAKLEVGEWLILRNLPLPKERTENIEVQTFVETGQMGQEAALDAIIQEQIGVK